MLNSNLIFFICVFLYILNPLTKILLCYIAPLDPTSVKSVFHSTFPSEVGKHREFKRIEGSLFAVKRHQFPIKQQNYQVKNEDTAPKTKEMTLQRIV